MQYATLVCSVTGKTSKFFGEYLEKKIKQYGTLENFQKHYVCREGRRLKKQPTLEFNSPGREVNIQVSKPSSYEVTTARTPANFEEWVGEFTSGPNGGVCIRPDIYLDGNGYCNECPNHKYCKCKNCRLKVVNTHK